MHLAFALASAWLLLIVLRLVDVFAGPWVLAMSPFFLLCAMPIVAPILSCILLTFTSPRPTCLHLWNCQRADPAEGVLFGTAGVLLGAFLFPLLISLVLLLPKMDGGDSGRLYIVALLPIAVQLFALFVAALVSMLRLLIGVLYWRHD
jgi:hypothetical protein